MGRSDVRLVEVLAKWDEISREARPPGLPARSTVRTALPMATMTGAAILVIAIAAAGLWLGIPARESPFGAEASAAATASRPAATASPPAATASPPAATASPPAATASPPAATASPPAATATWGPLAVIPPQDGTDLAGVAGRVVITETCVVLDDDGAPILLFWPADRTRWDPQAKAITFENYDGSGPVTVRNGDSVTLGGGGDSEAESGVSGEEWVARMKWVVPPASSCPLDERWGVGAIRK